VLCVITSAGSNMPLYRVVIPAAQSGNQGDRAPKSLVAMNVCRRLHGRNEVSQRSFLGFVFLFRFVGRISAASYEKRTSRMDFHEAWTGSSSCFILVHLTKSRKMLGTQHHSHQTRLLSIIPGQIYKSCISNQQRFSPVHTTP
jgi:hypothetical protein